jgi:hypothetical protein
VKISKKFSGDYAKGSINTRIKRATLKVFIMTIKRNSYILSRSSILQALCILTCTVFPAHAQAQQYVSAKQFAGEYEQELRENQEDKALWQVNVDGTIAQATYSEKESGLKSDFTALYLQAGCSIIRTSPSDVENIIRMSYGSSVTDTEQWDVNGIEYQNNDLSISRFALDISAGKKLFSERYKPLSVVPYVDYGFRYLNFERSNFDIINAILIRDTVNEQYYIQQIGAGIKAEYALSNAWSIGGYAQCSYPFYNVADNSVLGNINSAGGLCIDGALQMSYRFLPSWLITGSGEVQYQGINGGSDGNIIWPDNQFMAVGGKLSVEYTF